MALGYHLVLDTGGPEGMEYKFPQPLHCMLLVDMTSSYYLQENCMCLQDTERGWLWRCRWHRNSLEDTGYMILNLLHCNYRLDKSVGPYNNSICGYVYAGTYKIQCNVKIVRWMHAHAHTHRDTHLQCTPLLQPDYNSQPHIQQATHWGWDMNDPGGMLYTQQHQSCCYSDQSDKQLAVVTAEGSKILEGTVDNELNWWILQTVWKHKAIKYKITANSTSVHYF